MLEHQPAIQLQTIPASQTKAPCLVHEASGAYHLFIYTVKACNYDYSNHPVDGRQTPLG